MSETLLVKLGGSVITDKNSSDYNVRNETVTNCLQALKQFSLDNPETKLVLIHGAGGHIHYLAKTYGLTTSCAGVAEKIAHAYEVQKTTKRLSDDIVALALRLDFPLTQIPTCEVVTNKDGGFKNIALERIKKTLQSNGIPLLYGDMVPDETFDLSICSGDTLIAEIAPHIAATRIIYVSDIDGLYTSDPHQHEAAELIEKISVTELGNDRITITNSHSIDVTGGLKNKLEPAAQLFITTPSLISIEVCSGLKPNVLTAVLENQTVPHTTIVK